MGDQEAQETKQGVLKKASAAVDGGLYRFFYWWGGVVADYPVRVILVRARLCRYTSLTVKSLLLSCVVLP